MIGHNIRLVGHANDNKKEEKQEKMIVIISTYPSQLIKVQQYFKSLKNMNQKTIGIQKN